MNIHCNNNTINNFLSGLSWHAADDVRVSSISDGKGADTEELTASGSELDVISIVVMNSSLCQHSIVFNLGLSVN